MAHYTVMYYQDIIRHQDIEPCAPHSRAYRTADEAVIAARSELAAIRAKHGPDVGYVVFEGHVRAVAMGPGVYDHA